MEFYLMFQVLVLVLFASLGEGLAGSSLPCRSPLKWPFNSSSIWNTALGSSATFAPTALFPPSGGPRAAFFSLGVDEMVFLPASGSDPLTPWYNQGHWGQPKTPAAYCTVTGPQLESLHVPFNFTSTNFGGNNAVSLLLPDQETVLTMQPVYRCSPGSPLLALLPAPGQGTANLVTESGNLGGHGGSGLSGLGGALRLGEMLPASPPIPHAIQLEFYAHLFYYLPPSGNHSQCYTWPATQCDGYCFSNCTENPGCYGGSNPHLLPGALLAVPASEVAAVNASLSTAPARRLLQVLATFGGYVVDDTYWNATGITAEKGVAEEFSAAYGFGMVTDANAKGEGAQWYGDFLTLMRALQVVTNNRPETQGGGGAPLAPPPPPFCR